MRKNIELFVRYYCGTICLLLLFLPVSASAQTGVSVSANVLSGVSAGRSTFVSDILQLPADGKSVVVLTATILSKDYQRLPNKEVVVSSNRGKVDSIFCYAGITLTNKNTATSDHEGRARCVASSEVPGNATFTAVAETITLDDKPTVTFTPLPFLSNLTIRVNLPGGGKLTILEPAKPKPSKPANERLVNTDVELQIPFWVLLMLTLFFLTEPILIALILRLSRKVRRGFEAEKLALLKEQELLAKIYILEQRVVQTAAEIENEVRQIESPLLTPPQVVSATYSGVTDPTAPLEPPLTQSPNSGQDSTAKQI